jgi:intracellular sulfur oxidation DsrE/DsrF family protein
MNIQLLNLIMQGTMVFGLMLMLLLLIMPVIKGDRNNSSSARRHSVLEIGDSMTASQRFTLTRANKLLEQSNNTSIEIVALGNGVNLLLHDTPYKLDIQSLMNKGVIFTVCELSLKTLAERIGHSLEVLPGVRKTQNGHHYAEQLKDIGYIDELA